MNTVKKFRGEIPFFLQEREEEQILYLCSSYRNIEDYYPVLEDLMGEGVYRLDDMEEKQAERYELYDFAQKPGKKIILLTIDMFLEDFQARGELRHFVTGEEYSRKDIIEELEAHGYKKEYLVEAQGDYSLRGDILDIYPFTSTEAIRMEFFGEEVERLCLFDAQTQKSIEKKKSLDMYMDNNISVESLLQFINWKKEETKIYYENVELLSYKLEEKILLAEEEKEKIERYRERFQELYEEGEEVEIQQFTEEDLNRFQEEDAFLDFPKEVVFMAENTKKYKDRYKGGNLRFENYPLFEGYETEEKLVLSERELEGIRIRRQSQKRKKLEVKRPEQIHVGEYILHENFGLGIYQGMQLIDEKEYLQIQYAGEDKLFVPLEGINKIEKYVVLPGVVPEIYHLGRKGFQKKKVKLQEEIIAFAKELIHIQAKRAKGGGFVYSPDTVWQEEFEEKFPFTETKAQLKAIAEIKKEMEAGKIMDRLICGDVGYGKTEIAIRAAFKTIMDGKQVAVLAPTTILAEQHYQRFLERFRDYPFGIASMSRLKGKKEQNESIKGLAQGSIDLVIGTNRLLSEDIHFKDLGLVIIDEEQKFGVKAKSRFKALRGDVNILTMTATPIPRTLHLSLLGIRDFSLVDIAPEGRKPVKTLFIEKEEKTIRKAVLQELAREGQVFYIYNSVSRIKDKQKELQELLPSYVRVDYIHGKMSAKEMKHKIREFEENHIDVLIATTILENGIDITNANTMIIEGMERLGLSQVYQLRGRVGRGRRQSYCYCIVAEYSSKKGKKRESSLRELGEGTGYDLSLEDLKIRGAGEILGEKQHGAMETLGYHFYLKMLEEEMKKLKGELPEEKKEEDFLEIQVSFPKFIPDSYIAKEEKIVIYKRALELESKEELRALEAELRDRFGPFPEEVKGFFRFLDLRLLAKEEGITKIKETKEGYILQILDEKVKIEKITAGMQEGKMSYSAAKKELLWRGNLAEFFKFYRKK